MELAFFLLNITGYLADSAFDARDPPKLVVLKTLDVTHGTRTLEVILGPANFQTHHVLWNTSHGVRKILHFLKWKQRLHAMLVGRAQVAGSVS
jgi:hypothetical protein